MIFKKIIHYFKNQALKPRLFYFNTIVLSAIFYLAVEFQHENNTYYNIINSADRYCSNESDTAKLKSIVLHVHEMMRDRHKIFRNKEVLSWKQGFFKSVDADLMYGAGSCGGNSKVLARSLYLAGFKVRIGQLKANSYYGAHILMEAFSKDFNKWILIDPLFGVVVTDSTGYPLSYIEAEQHWDDIKNRFPLNYQLAYHYNGIRYTNWDKYGFLSKAIKSLAKCCMAPNKIEEFSLRPLLLSTYKVYLILLIALFIFFHGINFYFFNKK
jgi:hypothetical protein